MHRASAFEERVHKHRQNKNGLQVGDLEEEEEEAVARVHKSYFETGERNEPATLAANPPSPSSIVAVIFVVVVVAVVAQVIGTFSRHLSSTATGC